MLTLDKSKKKIRLPSLNRIFVTIFVQKSIQNKNQLYGKRQKS